MMTQHQQCISNNTYIHLILEIKESNTMRIRRIIKWTCDMLIHIIKSTELLYLFAMYFKLKSRMHYI